jgi:hypothetical protein
MKTHMLLITTAMQFRIEKTNVNHIRELFFFPPIRYMELLSNLIVSLRSFKLSYKRFTLYTCDASDRHSLVRTLMLILTPIRRSLRAYAILFMHGFSRICSSIEARPHRRCNRWFNQFYKVPWGCFARGACTYVVQIYPQKAPGLDMPAARDKVQLKPVDWSREQVYRQANVVISPIPRLPHTCNRAITTRIYRTFWLPGSAKNGPFVG